jgi:23S rRNA (guanosine2251-2'-O)-methyltransferase
MHIFGFHAVLSRLRRQAASIEALYLDEGRFDPRAKEVLKVAAAQGIRVLQVATDRLDKLCPGRKHQGVVAQVAQLAPLADSLDAVLDRAKALDAEGTVAGGKQAKRLLILDGVTDPRNLGACLRVADGAGVLAVIAPKDNACTLTETAVQTASGAAENLPYVMVTNLARALDDIQEAGFWCFGTADEAPKPIYEAELPLSIAWVLGAEGKGLRRLTRERCDELVRIPMLGSVESLNVSVASGIVLYESVRRSFLS